MQHAEMCLGAPYMRYTWRTKWVRAGCIGRLAQPSCRVGSSAWAEYYIHPVIRRVVAPRREMAVAVGEHAVDAGAVTYSVEGCIVDGGREVCAVGGVVAYSGVIG